MKRCSLVYKMAKWNQLIKNGNFVNTNDWRVLYNANFVVANNVGTITSTQQFGSILQNVPMIDTHKYLVSFNYSTTNTYWCVYVLKSQWNLQKIYLPTSGTSFSRIFSAKETDNCQFAIQNDGTTGTPTIDVSSVQLFDLTSIFGVGNEPTTYEAARTVILAEVGIDISEYHDYDAGSTIARRAKLTSESGVTMKRSALVLPKLPKEYQEVEWIESHGTELINTGLLTKANTTYEYKSKLKFIEATDNQLIGGVQGPYFGIQDDYFVITSQSPLYPATSADTNIHNFDVIVNTNSLYNTSYIDGVAHNSTRSLAYAYDRKIAIFGLIDQNDNYAYMCKLKIYNSFTILINNQLIRNFVPCYRKSDNTIGLYDLCGSICSLTNSPFYINSGTGTFTKGPNVY